VVMVVMMVRLVQPVVAVAVVLLQNTPCS